MHDIKTGVIGVGSMGQNHARIYSEISNFIGVYDPDKKQAEVIANRFNTNAFDNLGELLVRVDAVSIAVPTRYHLEVSKKAMEAGVHILVEKPLAGNIEDAEKILTLSQKYNLTLSVGHVERFNPVIKSSKSFIENKDWGDILTLNAKRFSNYPKRIHDVGVIYDLTIHDVNIMTSLVNKNVKTVFAAGGMAMNKKHEDFVCLTLIFEDGTLGICETNWLTPMKVRELNITTTVCYANINLLNQEIKILKSEYSNVDSSNLFKTGVDVNQKKIKVQNEEPLMNELDNFLDSIINEKNPLVDGQAGLLAVKLVQSGLESLQTGKAIDIKI